MSIERLEDLTTITFPRTVTEKEVWEILEYVSANLGYKIHNGNFSGFYHISDGETQERHISKIGGTITTPDFSGMASFSLLREVMGNLFTGLKFDTISGYDVEEHSEGTVKTWSETKLSVEGYFPEKEARERQGGLFD